MKVVAPHTSPAANWSHHAVEVESHVPWAPIDGNPRSVAWYDQKVTMITVQRPRHATVISLKCSTKEQEPSCIIIQHIGTIPKPYVALAGWCHKLLYARGWQKLDPGPDGSKNLAYPRHADQVTDIGELFQLIRFASLTREKTLQNGIAKFGTGRFYLCVQTISRHRH